MPQETTAQRSPYRDPTVGDIIVHRTSDDVDFHVDRQCLSAASPVFSDMFSIPAVPAESGKKPDVAVSETHTVWEKLLPLCSLAEEPPITLTDIPLLLKAGRKYQMDAVISRVHSHLSRPEFLDEQPFAVYALACMAGVPRAARLAARRTLATPIYPAYAQEFAHMSGRAMYNLFDYRRRCGIAASDVVLVTNSNEVPEWMRSSTVVLPSMKTCDSAPCVASGRTVYVRAKGTRFSSVRRSFMAYMERLHEALKLCPDSSLASADDMLGPVIASALECSLCASTIYEDAARCTEVLKTKIEEAISEVELVVES